MISFFCDLDNTLVYSHRTVLSDERVPVEYLNDHIQSYMTKKTYDFLNNSSNLFLIPTTTRTYEQYTRLSNVFTKKFGCRYALVCNGGVLLDNNKIDEQWFSETRQIAGQSLLSLDRARKHFANLFPEQSIHFVDDIMLYAKTDTPASDAALLSSLLSSDDLSIFFDSRKVYCIPSSINKGNAVKRFLSQMKIKCSISAGDSIADISMLKETNMAILPKELSDYVESKHKFIVNDSHCFSNCICDVLSMLISLK